MKIHKSFQLVSKMLHFLGILNVELQFQFARKEFGLKIMLFQTRLKSNIIVLLNKSRI